MERAHVELYAHVLEHLVDPSVALNEMVNCALHLKDNCCRLAQP